MKLGSGVNPGSVGLGLLLHIFPKSQLFSFLKKNLYWLLLGFSTILDYSLLQSKIQSISNGGLMTFRYSSHHPTCKSICKSGYVHKGCHYGHNCKINIHCTKNFCQCVLHLKCYPSSIGHAEYLSNEEIISQASYNVHEIVRLYFNYLGT